MAQSKVPPYQTYASQVPQTIRPDRTIMMEELVERKAGGDLNALAIAAGTTQDNATSLPNASSIIITGGTGTNGVRIPDGGPNAQTVVTNVSLSTVNLYPPPGGTINGGAADEPILLAAWSSVTLIGVTRNNWVTVGGVGGFAGGGGGAEIGVGTQPPNNLVVGMFKGQRYAQLDSGSSFLVRDWIFNGTPGTNTGWI